MLLASSTMLKALHVFCVNLGEEEKMSGQEEERRCKTTCYKPVKGSEEGGGFGYYKEDPLRSQKAQPENDLLPKH